MFLIFFKYIFGTITFHTSVEKIIDSFEIIDCCPHKNNSRSLEIMDKNIDPSIFLKVLNMQKNAYRIDKSGIETAL